MLTPKLKLTWALAFLTAKQLNNIAADKIIFFILWYVLKCALLFKSITGCALFGCMTIFNSKSLKY
jgi:hypothetical protein